MKRKQILIGSAVLATLFSSWALLGPKRDRLSAPQPSVSETTPHPDPSPIDSPAVRVSYLTGNTTADETLGHDFDSANERFTVLVKSSSSSHPDRRMPLEEFLKQFTREQCPTCSVAAFCNPIQGRQDAELCQIEWEVSRDIVEPNPQDAEPSSIWTLFYEKSKAPPRKVLPQTLEASWRDY